MTYPLVRDLAVEGVKVSLSCRVLGFTPQGFYKLSGPPDPVQVACPRFPRLGLRGWWPEPAEVSCRSHIHRSTERWCSNNSGQITQKPRPVLGDTPGPRDGRGRWAGLERVAITLRRNRFSRCCRRTCLTVNAGKPETNCASRSSSGSKPNTTGDDANVDSANSPQ